MTSTALSFRERVAEAQAERQRARDEEHARTETEARVRPRVQVRELIDRTLGADTIVDGEPEVNVNGWPSVRFTIDRIPFVAAYHEGEYHSSWHLYIEKTCTRSGCTMLDTPARVEVWGIEDVGEALSRNDAAHEWGLHCTEKKYTTSPRSITQIAACAWAANLDKEDGGMGETLFALCDDGTLWERDSRRSKWVQIDAPNGVAR